MTAINTANLGLCNELFDAIVVKLGGKAICALSRVSKAFQEAVIDSLARQRGAGVDWFYPYVENGSLSLDTQLHGKDPQANALPIKITRRYIDLNGEDTQAFQKVSKLPNCPFKCLVTTIITKKRVLENKIEAAVELVQSLRNDTVAEEWNYYTLTTLMFRKKAAPPRTDLFDENPEYLHRNKVWAAFRIASKEKIDLALEILETTPPSIFVNRAKSSILNTLLHQGRALEVLPKIESLNDPKNKLRILFRALDSITTLDQCSQASSALEDMQVPQDLLLFYEEVQRDLTSKLFKMGKFSEAIKHMESLDDPEAKLSLLREAIKSITTLDQYRQVSSALEDMQVPQDLLSSYRWVQSVLTSKLFDVGKFSEAMKKMEALDNPNDKLVLLRKAIKSIATLDQLRQVSSVLINMQVPQNLLWKYKEVQKDLTSKLFKMGKFSEAIKHMEAFDDPEDKLDLLRKAIKSIPTLDQLHQVSSVLINMQVPQDFLRDSKKVQKDLISKLFKMGKFSEAIKHMESLGDPTDKLDLLREAIKSITTLDQYRQVSSALEDMQVPQYLLSSYKRAQKDLISKLFDVGKFSEAMKKMEALDNPNDKLVLLRKAIKSITTLDQLHQVSTAFVDIQVPQDLLWKYKLVQKDLISKLFKMGKFSEAMKKMEAFDDPEDKLDLLREAIKSINTLDQYRQVSSVLEDMQVPQNLLVYYESIQHMLASAKCELQETLKKPK